MSSSVERADREDAGFSLVEVVVAVGIVAVLVVATLPALLGGMKAGDAARRLTQAKSIALGEMERMRNLPFWVARNAGEFIDVLDRYYTDRTPPSAPPACGSVDAWIAPAAGARGYVANDAPRCAWEPPGAFFRSVRTGSTATGDDGFVVVVDLQFLTDTSPPVPVDPPADWTTQTVNRDRPPAQQVGATVTVFPAERTVRTPVQTHTQISRHEQAVTRIRASVDAAALQVGTSVSTAGEETPLTVSAGVLTLGSSTTYASSVDAVLSGVSAGLGTGQQARGATRSASAPPAVTATAVDLSSGGLDDGTCHLVCWGGTRVSEMPVSAAGGLPNAGSPGAPLTAMLKEPSSGGQALTVAAGASAAYRPNLSLVAPVVRARSGTVGTATTTACQALSSGTPARVAATGWLRATSPTDAGSPSLVEACGTARLGVMAVLPTSFAPHGIIRLRLERVSASCRVSGSAHAATSTVDYLASVWRWVPDSDSRDDPVSDYQLVATISPSTASDVLAGVPLATTPVPGHGVLGDWIAAWSNLAPGGVRRETAAGSVAVTVPGVVTVLTQPLRHRVDAAGALVRDGAGDPLVEPASTLSLTLGAVSCRAEDAR